MITLPTHVNKWVAIKAGMEKATGEYIAFIETGNKFLPHKIERQIKFMLDGHNASNTSYSVRYNKTEEFHTNVGNSDTTSSNIIGADEIPISTFMVNRRFILDNNITMDSPQTCGGVPFFLDVCKYTTIKGLPIAFTIAHRMPKTFNPYIEKLMDYAGTLQLLLNKEHVNDDQMLDVCDTITQCALRYINYTADEAVSECPIPSRQVAYNITNKDLQAQIKALEMKKKEMESTLRDNIQYLQHKIDVLNGESNMVIERIQSQVAGLDQSPQRNVHPRHPTVRFIKKPI
jgi:hypothetical protein